MTKKICVVETNEVPIRVWQEYCKAYPESTLARMFGQGKLYCTRADDVPDDFLYPSQTWASLNTGVPYEQHQIHWYNDPKPDRSLFWWHQAAKNGKHVGLVNVLHTSPLSALRDEASYDFVLPDCFSPTVDTFPSRYEAFQSLNLQLTEKNGRASTSGLSDLRRLAGKAVFNPGTFGLSPFTVIETARAAPGILRSRERLRSLQFPPLGSIFLDLVKRHDCDIAVMFTNHIAAAQHRYWYALFPQDYPEQVYDEAWVGKYRNDILNAVDLFDRYMKKLSAFCEATDRILIVVSSMGQQANRTLTREYVSGTSLAHRLDKPVKFINAVLGRNLARFERAMVPQYTYVFPDTASATKAMARLRRFLEINPALRGSSVDIVGTKVTVTIWVSGTPADLQIEMGSLPLDAFGFQTLQVEDHHAGCHSPDGTLLVWNDRRDELFSSRDTPESFSYLRYANELRRYLGLATPRTGAYLSTESGARVHDRAGSDLTAAALRLAQF